MKDFYFDALDKSFSKNVISHRRDPENNPGLTLGDQAETVLMRTLRLLLALETGPLLQIDHLPLHQGRVRDNTQEVLNLEKVNYMTLPK